jgi:hypothetical protein
MILVAVVMGRLQSIGVAVCSGRPVLRTPARNYWLAISTWIESTIVRSESGQAAN